MLAQLADGRFGIVDQDLDGLGYFPQVVGRDIGGHADRDAARPVHQQVGDLGREDSGLAKTIVEIGLEIGRVLVDILQHRHRNVSEPRLGVAIGRGGISVHRAEVALTVDERVTQREVLNHPDQRVVNRGVAMRMVLAQDIANHGRRFLIGTAGYQAQLVHRVKNPAVHRLETVAHIGERARHDDTHRVVDERLLHLLFDEARQNPFARIRGGHEYPY